MKSNRKKNKKAPQKFGGLSIQKRQDKRGNNYYIDKKGKRRKEIEYAVQWSKKGRVSKASFEETIKNINEENITDIKEARLLVDDFEVIRKAEPLRKKEIELMESRSTKTSLFFRATDIVNQAIKGGAKIKILKPTGKIFVNQSPNKAMEIAHLFIDSVGESLDEINEGSSGEITSPMIRFNFQHSIAENVFYLDFKNLSGFDDLVLLNQLIKDNFRVGI